MIVRLKPRAEELLLALVDCAEPIGRDDLARKAKLSNRNITPEMGATNPDIRNKYEGKSGKEGYTASETGCSLLGLGLVASEKQQYDGRRVDVFWITEKGKAVVTAIKNAISE